MPTGFKKRVATGDAVAADLLLNKKATVQGGKQIIGTLVPSGGSDPSQGLTSPATAADILSPKKAAVGGSVITGTIPTRSSVDITANKLVNAGYYPSDFWVKVPGYTTGLTQMSNPLPYTGTLAPGATGNFSAMIPTGRIPVQIFASFTYGTGNQMFACAVSVGANSWSVLNPRINNGQISLGAITYDAGTSMISFSMVNSSSTTLTLTTLDIRGINPA